MTNSPPVPIFYGFCDSSSKKQALREAVKLVGYTDKSEIERVIRGFPEPVLYTEDDRKIEAYELTTPKGKRLEIGIEKARWHNPPNEGFALFLLMNKEEFHKISLQVKKKHK
jgi:hypothetical protein